MKIGITGGIGSGKTTACKLLEQWGYPVYYSDGRGKYLMEHNPEVRTAVKALFGEEAYANGTLNRQFLAEQIFNSPEKRQVLNAIVHPAVKRDYLVWLAQQQSKITFKESALLFETGAYKELDATILITAPEDMRIARVMKRDQVSEAAVKARIHAQMQEGAKRSLANYTVENTDLAELEIQLKTVVQQFNR
jgi:dephospho-CoA kinase